MTTAPWGSCWGRTSRWPRARPFHRCLDRLLAHKTALFSCLHGCWQSLFDVRFDVLRYDLTSTYIEFDPPGYGKRRFGYSRDKRPNCVQVVIALIVTPTGFRLADEVLAGASCNQTTLEAFLANLEAQYGQANRVRVMDRGIPTEEVLAKRCSACAP